MALIAPLAGAALGGLATGGAMWAMSAGWLIGSWLFQEKNDEQNTIIDPGAEEMPRFNQALRGVTLPVLFGTNRVSSQIVWQKNFTTIRHESTQGGGGGKGGGSGMGAKGGGPSTTQVSYEYKWDLLFHLGMTDDEFSLFGGWLVAERLNDSTLLAIANGSNSGFGAGLFRSDVNRRQNAELTFDEGFFYGATGPGTTNWDHFEAQEGHAFEFPYTTYVGFKQLNLGAHAVVPQLSWEIGPGDIDLTFDSAHKFYGNSHVIGGNMGTRDAIRGEDGNIYFIDHAAGNNMFRIFREDGTLIDTKTDAEFDQDCSDNNLDPTNSYVFDATIGSTVVPNKNVILAWGQDIGVGSRSNWAILMYKVNTSGVLEVVGGYAARAGNSEDVSGAAACGVFGEGTDNDPILIWGNSSVGADDELFMQVMPSYNEMLQFNVEDDANIKWTTRLTSLRTEVTEIASNFGIQSSYREYVGSGWGCIVPTVTIGAGPSWASKLIIFIGKSDIEWHIDNPASGSGSDTVYNITSSHPYGGIFSITINSANENGVTVNSSWTDEAANFIDASSETTMFPTTGPVLEDSGYNIDGTTVADSDDYSPTGVMAQQLTSGVAAGATLIMFVKNIDANSNDRSINPGNTYTRIHAFLWNPLSQIAKRYVDQHGGFADTNADWGIGDTESYSINGVSAWFDEVGKEVYISGCVDGGGASDDVFAASLGTFNIGGGEDVFPPYIIYKILTSPIYGFNISTDAVDATSYNLALQYCEAQDIKVSVQYRREESKLAVINELLALYGGYLIDSGGKIRFGLSTFANGVYANVIRTLDNHHLMVNDNEPPVTITAGAKQDTFNKVKVNYFDRDLEYRQNFVEISDEVDQDLHGVRAQEFPPKFVMKERVAIMLATRTLWSNLYKKNIYQFRLGPKDADLEPGDVVTLVDSFHTELQSGKQVRIVEWAEREPMVFSVKAIEDVEYISEVDGLVNSSQLATQNNLFGPALPAADFTMYELPKEFQGATPQIFVGYRQQSLSKGARLYTSADGVSFAQVQESQPYIISGILSEGLPTRSAGYVEEGVTLYLMPDTYSGNWSVASNTWCQTFALDDVSASGRAIGAGLIWVNSEMMAYENISLLGQNQYRMGKVYRGWGGTHIQEHSSGDTWHKHGGGIFTQGFNEDKIGTIIHYKVAPFNFAGVEYNISSVDAKTYQIQGTYFTPQNPPAIHTFIQSPATLTVQSEDLGYIARKRTISGGSNIQFEWHESARARGYGSRGYGVGGYGRFEQDTNSVQWRVEVLSSDLSTVVRSTTVNTPIYVYSRDVNSTDFNGWAGSFQLRVTPFNEFGDSLRTQVKTLELFEQ